MNYGEFLGKLTKDQREDLEKISNMNLVEAINKYLEMIKNNRTGILYRGKEYKTYTMYKHAWDSQQDYDSLYGDRYDESL